MNFNSINSINNSAAIYGLYDTMFQGSMALNNIRLNKNLFPNNKAQGFQQLGGDAVQYVNKIKSASKNLSGSLKELSGAAFAKKGVVSSDTDAMTVSYSGNKPGSIKPTTVKIDQTAAGQVNEGKSLRADANFGSSGTQKFSINVGGKSTEISVNVQQGDSNSVVQQKMADAINNAGVGVKASVETDSKNNTSMLKLEAESTGDNNKSKFTVTDITGNLTEKTGADEVSQNARDARYSVNGGAVRTSQSNTVDLGGGLSATLKKASEKEVAISTSTDMDYVKNAVKDLVKNYNDLYSEAAQRTNDPKAQNLAGKMVNISKTYSGSLSNIGIGFDNDGRMTLDTAKLDAAADSGRLERFFTENSGRNYGFTNQLSRLSDSVSRNTSGYLSRSTFGDSLTENFAYSGFGELIQYNYLSSGWILDYSY